MTNNGVSVGIGTECLQVQKEKSVIIIKKKLRVERLYLPRDFCTLTLLKITTNLSDSQLFVIHIVSLVHAEREAVFRHPLVHVLPSLGSNGHNFLGSLETHF